MAAAACACGGHGCMCMCVCVWCVWGMVVGWDCYGVGCHTHSLTPHSLLPHHPTFCTFSARLRAPHRRFYSLPLCLQQLPPPKISTLVSLIRSRLPNLGLLFCPAAAASTKFRPLPSRLCGQWRIQRSVFDGAAFFPSIHFFFPIAHKISRELGRGFVGGVGGAAPPLSSPLLPS